MDLFVIPLLSTLAGGAIGIGTQWLIDRFNRRKEREAVLRTKGEELVMALLEGERWFEYYCKDFFGKKEEKKNRFIDAHALQRLYFPTLDQQMRELLGSQSRFRMLRHELLAQEPTVDMKMAESGELGVEVIRHRKLSHDVINAVCAVVRGTLVRT